MSPHQPAGAHYCYSRFIVSVAIISSSSVGMTTTFTFESSAEMIALLATLVVLRLVELHTQELQTLANLRTHSQPGSRQHRQ